jgi:hypothetical protein
MPGYTPPAAAEQPKKKGGCAKVGCLGAAGVLVLVAVVAVAANYGSSSSSSSAGGATSKAAAPASGAAAPVTSKAAAPAVVLKLAGNGIKNSPQFTTGDNWTVNYSYDCSGVLGGQGNFQVYVDYPGGDVAVNELGAKGASSSSESGAGAHSLKVVSECPWTVTVTNG